MTVGADVADFGEGAGGASRLQPTIPAIAIQAAAQRVRWTADVALDGEDDGGWGMNITLPS